MLTSHELNLWMLEELLQPGVDVNRIRRIQNSSVGLNIPAVRREARSAKRRRRG